MALPWASVMVIMVLLNVALTCATPDVMFFRSRRRTRVCVGCLAIVRYAPSHGSRHAESRFPGGRYFFLPAIGFAGPLRVRASCGSADLDRQTLAVPETAKAAEIHQTFDVHRDLAAEVTLNDEVTIDHLTQTAEFVLGQLMNPALARNADRFADRVAGPTDTMYVSQRSRHAFASGYLRLRCAPRCLLLKLTSATPPKSGGQPHPASNVRTTGHAVYSPRARIIRTFFLVSTIPGVPITPGSVLSFQSQAAHDTIASSALLTSSMLAIPSTDLSAPLFR